jgi:hypothetical protein
MGARAKPDVYPSGAALSFMAAIYGKDPGCEKAPVTGMMMGAA